MKCNNSTDFEELVQIQSLPLFYVMNEIVSIDKEKCNGCGACIQKCPQQILYINRKTMTCDVDDQSRCDRIVVVKRYAHLERLR